MQAASRTQAREAKEENIEQTERNRFGETARESKEILTGWGDRCQQLLPQKAISKQYCQIHAAICM